MTKQVEHILEIKNDVSSESYKLYKDIGKEIERIPIKHCFRIDYYIDLSNNKIIKYLHKNIDDELDDNVIRLEYKDIYLLCDKELFTREEC